MKPTALIATTTNWVPAARLAVALANAGFRVEVLCPSGHPVSKSRAASRTHAYQGLTPLRSFARAIATSNPDVVVPGDDLATRHLHDLYDQRELHSEDAAMLSSLIERSLGSPQSFSIVQSRAAFMELAQKEGIRVPRTEVLRSAEDVNRWVERAGLPTVL